MILFLRQTLTYHHQPVRVLQNGNLPLGLYKENFVWYTQEVGWELSIKYSSGHLIAITASQWPDCNDVDVVEANEASLGVKLVLKLLVRHFRFLIRGLLIGDYHFSSSACTFLGFLWALHWLSLLGQIWSSLYRLRACIYVIKLGIRKGSRELPHLFAQLGIQMANVTCKGIIILHTFAQLIVIIMTNSKWVMFSWWVVIIIHQQNRVTKSKWTP